VGSKHRHPGPVFVYVLEGTWKWRSTAHPPRCTTLGRFFRKSRTNCICRPGSIAGAAAPDIPGRQMQLVRLFRKNLPRVTPWGGAPSISTSTPLPTHRRTRTPDAGASIHRAGLQKSIRAPLPPCPCGIFTYIFSAAPCLKHFLLRIPNPRQSQAEISERAKLKIVASSCSSPSPHHGREKAITASPCLVPSLPCPTRGDYNVLLAFEAVSHGSGLPPAGIHSSRLLAGFRIECRMELSIVAPVKTSPPAVTIGPPRLMVPVCCPGT